MKRKVMKKLLLLAVSTITSLTAFTPAFALESKTEQIIKYEEYEQPNFTESNAFKLYINGIAKQIQNTFAVSNNRTFLPMREVAKLLGVDDSNIQWDSSNQTAIINSNNILIEIPIGRTKANVNDKIVFLDDSQGGTRSFVKQTSAGGVTYLPLRFLAENLGYQVKYYSDTNTIHIYNTKIEPEILGVNTIPDPEPEVPNVNQTTTADGTPIDSFILEWGGQLLDENEYRRWMLGTANNTGSLPFDFNGDGLIDGYTGQEFSAMNPDLQRAKVMNDFQDILKAKYASSKPTTPGTRPNEQSPDKHWAWGGELAGWLWSPDADSNYTKTCLEMSTAIDNTSEAYLNK